MCLLRHRRERLGLSREQLCELLRNEVSVNTLANFETCDSLPRLDLWLSWRAELGLGPPALEQFTQQAVARKSVAQ
jgi:transcriptional regulator with XRE-family HTH domain